MRPGRPELPATDISWQVLGLTLSFDKLITLHGGQAKLSWPYWVTPIMQFLVGAVPSPPLRVDFHAKINRKPARADVASGLIKVGKVWRGRDRTPGWGLAAAGKRARHGAAPFTASEESGDYVGRPKNERDESEGLLQGGD